MITPTHYARRGLLAAVGSATLAASAAGVLSLAPTAALAESAPSNDIVQAVAALRAIDTMRADFVQTDANGGRLTGVVTMKRPGRIRFQYQPGVPLLIVSDGAALTMIDYEVRQVQRWPIRNSPLGALLDPSRDVIRFARLNPTGRPDLISLSVRDTDHPEYGTLTLLMIRKASAPGGLQLDSWISTDAQSRRTMVRLLNPQYGIAVNDSTFRWTDPRQQNHKAG
jgi:outer membrane lipoprotein-sorting protein